MAQYQKQCPETIQDMFNQIAHRYDRANGVMSLQLHKLWNRRLIRDLIQAKKPEVLVDLCCGTGEIGFGYLKIAQTPCRAYFLDFSSEMLECAKHKASKMPFSQHQIEYLQADAQQIPLQDASVDCATMAYGIRNVQDPLKSASDVFRILKPEGVFGILELTRPKNPLMKIGHQFYLRMILPLVGKLVSRNQDAYQYLSQSIDQFISPEEMVKLLREAGFSSAESRPLFGGIATLFIAQK